MKIPQPGDIWSRPTDINQDADGFHVWTQYYEVREVMFCNFKENDPDDPVLVWKLFDDDKETRQFSYSNFTVKDFQHERFVLEIKGEHRRGMLVAEKTGIV